MDILRRYLKLFIILLCILLNSCEPEGEEKIHDIDKKYLSESQLFALHQAIEQNPNDPELYFKRARVYFERGEAKKSLADIDKAIQLKTGEGKFYFLQAKVFYKLKNYPSAIDAAHKAEGYNFKDAELKIFLAKCLLDNNDKLESQKYLDQALILTPNHSEVSYLKARHQALAGDTASAVKIYFSALHQDTNNIDVYKELASIYFSKNKFDSSLMFLSIGRTIDPSEPFFYCLEGRYMEHNNLKEAAKRFYQAAMNFDSTFAEAYNRLAMMYYKEGNYNQAARFFQKELIYNSGSPKTNLYLAEIYEKNNQGNLAIPLLEKVFKMDTSNKAVKEKLTMLYALYPQVKKDTVKAIPDTVKPVIVDTARKVVVKPTDSLKHRVQPGKDLKKKDTNKDSSKEIKKFVPLIKNPDSSKIEIRKDTTQ